MKDRIDNLSIENISLIEAEVRLDATTIREDFRTFLDQTTNTADDQGMDKIIEIGQDMILIIEVVMDTIQEVIKGMGDRIIIITTERQTLEIKIMIAIGVGHTKGRIETEGTVEMLVTVDEGQVQGQLQMEIGLDALNVENMTILQGTVQLCRQIEKQNRSNRCSIWMRIKQYYKPSNGCRSRWTDYKSSRD